MRLNKKLYYIPSCAREAKQQVSMRQLYACLFISNSATLKILPSHCLEVLVNA